MVVMSDEFAAEPDDHDPVTVFINPEYQRSLEKLRLKMERNGEQIRKWYEASQLPVATNATARLVEQMEAARLAQEAESDRLAEAASLMAQRRHDVEQATLETAEGLATLIGVMIDTAKRQEAAAEEARRVAQVTLAAVVIGLGVGATAALPALIEDKPRLVLAMATTLVVSVLAALGIARWIGRRKPKPPLPTGDGSSGGSDDAG